jgi:hypothetical protein
MSKKVIVAACEASGNAMSRNNLNKRECAGLIRRPPSRIAPIGITPIALRFNRNFRLYDLRSSSPKKPRFAGANTQTIRTVTSIAETLLDTHPGATPSYLLKHHLNTISLENPAGFRWVLIDEPR